MTTVSCEQAREAISARLDHEDLGMEPATLDAHLAGCGPCVVFASAVARDHQRVRVRPAEAVPDLSGRILAALSGTEAPKARRHVPVGWGTRRRPRRRWALPASVAAVVVAAVLVGAGILATRHGDGQPAAGAGAPAGAGATVRQVEGSTQTDARYPGSVVLARAVAKPDVTLTDTSGQPYNIATETAGRVTLLYFGYTHCPDVCPINMALTATALRKMAPAQRDRIIVIFITTDPARDTPSVIRAWLDKFDPSFVGLTGTLSQIQAAEEAVQMPLSYAETSTAGGYLVVHAGYTLVYSQDGLAHLQVDDTETFTGLSTSLDHLLEGGYRPERAA